MGPLLRRSTVCMCDKNKECFDIPECDSFIGFLQADGP